MTGFYRGFGWSFGLELKILEIYGLSQTTRNFLLKIEKRIEIEVFLANKSTSAGRPLGQPLMVPTIYLGH